MSESEVSRLSRLENIEEDQAERALNYVEDGFDEARKIIHEAPAAIKFRFRSDSENMFGIGIVILALSPVGLKKFNSVVGNREEFQKIPLDRNYQSFHEDISGLKKTESFMSSRTEDLNQSIRAQFSTPKRNWIPLVESRNTVGLEDNLEDFLGTVLDLDELQVAAELEIGLLDLEDRQAEEAKDDTDESDESDSINRDSDSVTLLCDIRVSPIKGTPVQEIVPGDLLYVDIKDNQEQHKSLLQVMKKLRDELVGLIPAKVKEIGETKTGKVEIIVQFGQNVYGKAIAQKGMNLLTPLSLEQSGNGNRLKFILKWGAIGFLLVLIGSILLYAIFLA